MVFEWSIRLHVPNFWRWIVPSYRRGYRDGLDDAGRAINCLRDVAMVNINRPSRYELDLIFKPDVAFVGEGSTLPK